MAKSRTVYGQEAEKFKDLLEARQARKLANRAIKPERDPSTIPMMVSNPRNYMIQSRLKRFNYDISLLSQQYCLGRFQEPFYLGHVIYQCEKFFRTVAGMPMVRLDKRGITLAARKVGDNLAKFTQGIPRQQINMAFAPKLTKIVMGTVDDILGGRTEVQNKLAEEKIKKSSKIGSPEFKRLLEKKIGALGLDVKDMPGLIATAKHMGIDVDRVMKQIEDGETPPELEGLING